MYTSGASVSNRTRSLSLCYRSYHSAAGKRASVSSLFVFHHQPFIRCVINNKYTAAKVRASPRKMLRTRMRES